MKKPTFSIITVICCLLSVFLMGQNDAKAQFSKPVVVFKGKVRNAQTLEPHSVKVSVRETNNKAVEITSSRSNSESGNYLVVLKPNTVYWLHMEGNGVETKEIMIKTPPVLDKTITVEEDIPVKVRSMSQAIGTN